MDDATIKEMVNRGTVYVPTVEHNRYYIAHRDEFGYDDAVVKRLEAYVQRNLETLRRAIKAGDSDCRIRSGRLSSSIPPSPFRSQHGC